MAASITEFNEAKRRWKLLRPQADNVETSPALARKIVDYFQPRGLCLDPCRRTAKGVFTTPSQNLVIGAKFAKGGTSSGTRGRLIG